MDNKKYKYIAVLAALILLAIVGPKAKKNTNPLDLPNGSYVAQVALEGGTGRAGVVSPAKLDMEDGTAYLTLVWSSSNYDYMIVDGTRYDFITVEGGSTFRFPIKDVTVPITADTLAMSTPHEIDYTLTLSDIAPEK